MRRVQRILKIRRRRKWLLRMAVKLKTPKRATTTLKTTVRKQKVIAMKRPPPFTLKIPVNIVIILMCTGHWSWNVLNALGTIHPWFVLYVITRSPRREITWKRAFFGATIVEQWHKNVKTLETTFYSHPKEENEEDDLFPSLSNLRILLFLLLVFNKVFKTASRVCFF